MRDFKLEPWCFGKMYNTINYVDCCKDCGFKYECMKKVESIESQKRSMKVGDIKQ
jgi:hypothetical protein